MLNICTAAESHRSFSGRPRGDSMAGDADDEEDDAGLIESGDTPRVISQRYAYSLLRTNKEMERDRDRLRQKVVQLTKSSEHLMEENDALQGAMSDYTRQMEVKDREIKSAPVPIAHRCSVAHIAWLCRLSRSAVRGIENAVPTSGDGGATPFCSDKVHAAAPRHGQEGEHVQAGRLCAHREIIADDRCAHQSRISRERACNHVRAR
jgi:hypothetical protein